MNEELRIAEVVQYDNSHVWVKCPYCDKIHVHGRNNGDFDNTRRAPHCIDEFHRKDYILRVTMNTEKRKVNKNG